MGESGHTNTHIPRAAMRLREVKMQAAVATDNYIMIAMLDSIHYIRSHDASTASCQGYCAAWSRHLQSARPRIASRCQKRTTGTARHPAHACRIPGDYSSRYYAKRITQNSQDYTHTHTHRPLFSPQIRPSFVTGRQLIGGRQRLNEFFRSSPPSLCIFLPLRLKYILLATNECR